MQQFVTILASTLVFLKSKLQIGGGGPILKNDSGTIQARNAADNAFAKVQIADAAADDDALNRRTADARYGAYAVQWYKLSGTTGSATGTGTIPANSLITEIRVQIDTALDGSATMDIGTTGDADAFVPNTEINPGAAQFTPFFDNTLSVGGSAVTPKVTIGGSPTTGAYTILIGYLPQANA